MHRPKVKLKGQPPPRGEDRLYEDYIFGPSNASPRTEPSLDGTVFQLLVFRKYTPNTHKKTTARSRYNHGRLCSSATDSKLSRVYSVAWVQPSLLSQKLRLWLGSAAVLLREHLQGQHREGSVVSEGNQCHLNRGCDLARCSVGSAAEEMGAAGGGSGGESVASGAAAESAAGEGEGLEAEGSGQEAGDQVSRDGSGAGATRTGTLRGQQTCVPTAEEEGLPLPAAMTLRFLAAMDEGYVGSRREENARLKRRMKEGGAG